MTTASPVNPAPSRRWHVPRSRRTLMVALAIVLLGTAVAVPVLARSDGQGLDKGVQKQLAEVRQATTRFHDVNVALAEGYTPIPIKGDLCVTHEHHGAMGIHYINPGLVEDGELNPLTPELLLYQPTKNGVRLIGVEYFIPDSGQAHPELFGRALDGPNATLLPEIPVHYSLHAWIWQANPAGMFQPYNRNIRC
jgi:hypothetical protein